MKTKQWFSPIVLILLLSACGIFRSSSIGAEKGTILEVYVSSFTATIYALRDGAGISARTALSGCYNVSGFRKCVLPWNIANPQSGVIFQVKLSGYPDCPLITEFSSIDLRHRCYNTPAIYDFDEQVLVLKINFPLTQSGWDRREKTLEDNLSPREKRRVE